MDMGFIAALLKCGYTFKTTDGETYMRVNRQPYVVKSVFSDGSEKTLQELMTELAEKKALKTMNLN